MGSNPDTELCWTALRYVCGELDADESGAFEQRLDQDQAAREAVAEAVELAGAVARLKPSAVSILAPPRHAGVRSFSRWAALAAASVLVTLVVRSVWISAGPGDARPSAPSAVALAWSGVHEGEDETDSLLAWLDTTPTPIDTHLAAPLDSPENAEAGVPDWMLAAASLDGGAPGETPERQEN